MTELKICYNQNMRQDALDIRSEFSKMEKINLPLDRIKLKLQDGLDDIYIETWKNHKLVGRHKVGDFRT